MPTYETDRSLRQTRIDGQPARSEELRVECYAGYRGEETPRRFRLGSRRIEITAVVDRWLAPDHRYFKVEDADGNRYLLRQDMTTLAWTLAGDASHGRP